MGEAAAERGPDTPLFAVVMSCAAVGAWAVVLAVLVTVVPRFEAVFTDFGVELPLLTLALLDLTRWLRGSGQALPGAALVVAPGLLVLAMPVACAYGRRTRWLAVVLPIVLIGAAFASIVVVVIGLTVPMGAMAKALGG